MSSPKESGKQNLSQPEREAIVDLLHFCMYGDSHIALKESAFVSQVVDTIGWDTNLSFSSYEARSIANARAAKESPDNRREFLASVATRLRARDARSLAVDLCQQMMMADGTKSDTESAMIADIIAALP